MKTPRIFIIFLLAMILLLANRSLAAAFPPLPAAYYGDITVNGVNAPIGAVVTAWVGGVRYASGVVTLYQGRSVYSLVVPGDDRATSQIEGGRPGDMVIFRMGSLQADQVAVWSEGANLSRDLSMVVDPTILPRLYLPLVAKR